MIVPMKKYTFLVYHKDYTPFLKKIQELGALHVIEKDIELDENIKSQQDKIKKIKDIYKFLKSRKQEQLPQTDIDANQIVQEVADLRQEQEKNTQQISVLNKEIEIVKPWGNFSVEKIARLQNEANLEINFHSCPEKQFKEKWKEEFAIEIIGRKGSSLYFILLFKQGEDPEFPVEKLKAPARPVIEAEEDKKKLLNRNKLINETFDKYASKYLHLLTEFDAEVTDDSEFDRVLLHSGSEAENKLKTLEGYVPETKMKELDTYLNTTNAYFVAEDPSPEDELKVPIVLKNNKFSALFEPIGKLFSLPSYAEIDLTAFMAPFFMFFFGFCLGDAGYGITILLVTSLFKGKVPGEYRPFMTLGQFLGLATIIMGVISGTFFGINLIQNETLLPSNIREMFLDSNQMFNLAIGFGLFQSLFGMVIKAANEIKQKSLIYAFPTFGWIILVISLVLMVVVEPAAAVAKISSLVGVALILFFSDPKVNIFKRIGIGLWDLYNITGLFGDILSYIRLFALGVSGAILGLVINSIGAEFLKIPYVGYIVWIVFLIVGHTGNILLSGLGSFVHPMRLTFVEFYKNSGWTGGGKDYKPFAKKIKK